VTDRPRTSTRDVTDLIQQLAAWLAQQLRSEDEPRIERLRGPGAAGFSSETLLFDLEWRADGEQRSGSYVLRLPPPQDAYPLFPRYELDRQVSAMRFVRERSNVPVPAIRWFEPSGDVLGAPFFVMEQIEGLVVPDIPPYVFQSWVTAATVHEQARMRRGATGLLVGIHGIDVDPDDLNPWALDLPGATPLTRHVANQRCYYDWIRGDDTYAIIDATFAWLEEHWPENEGNAVLSWGDSRLANVLWRDFEPVAVFDWEMAGLAPREADLAWFVFLHRFFEDLAHGFELPGLPDFLRQDEVCAQYEELTGYTPRDMVWYELYAALRFAIIYFRIQRRRIHFGEASMPDDPDEMIIHHALLRRMLEAVR